MQMGHNFYYENFVEHQAPQTFTDAMVLPGGPSEPESYSLSWLDILFGNLPSPPAQRFSGLHEYCYWDGDCNYG